MMPRAERSKVSRQSYGLASPVAPWSVPVCEASVLRTADSPSPSPFTAILSQGVARFVLSSGGPGKNQGRSSLPVNVDGSSFFEGQLDVALEHVQSQGSPRRSQGFRSFLEKVRRRAAAFKLESLEERTMLSTTSSYVASAILAADPSSLAVGWIEGAPDPTTQTQAILAGSGHDKGLVNSPNAVTVQNAANGKLPAEDPRNALSPSPDPRKTSTAVAQSGSTSALPPGATPQSTEPFLPRRRDRAERRRPGDRDVVGTDACGLRLVQCQRRYRPRWRHRPGADRRCLRSHRAHVRLDPGRRNRPDDRRGRQRRQPRLPQQL